MAKRERGQRGAGRGIPVSVHREWRSRVMARDA